MSKSSSGTTMWFEPMVIRRPHVQHRELNSSRLGMIVGALLAVIPVSAMFNPLPLGQNMNFAALDLSRSPLTFGHPRGADPLGGWEARATRRLPGALTDDQFMPRPVTLGRDTLRQFHDLQARLDLNRNTMDLMWMYHYEPHAWRALHEGNEKLANLPFTHGRTTSVPEALQFTPETSLSPDLPMLQGL